MAPLWSGASADPNPDLFRVSCEGGHRHNFADLKKTSKTLPRSGHVAYGGASPEE
jgi:hypothetical protein